MLEPVAVFIAGSIVGSFLNVCIHRLPRGESIIAPSSYCPSCKRPIPWYDNIPLASYLVLRGKCRHCKERIRVRYLIVEALTALVFIALYLKFGLSVKFFAGGLFASMLIIATFVDLEHEEIPDEVSLGGLIVWPVASFFVPQLLGAATPARGLFESLLGAIVGGGSVYAMGVLGKMIFRKEAMGEGDVKLMGMIGSFLGWRLALLTFFMAPFFGAVVGIAQKLKTGKEVIPYGPYLSLAALLALYIGDEVLKRLF